MIISANILTAGSVFFVQRWDFRNVWTVVVNFVVVVFCIILSRDVFRILKRQTSSLPRFDSSSCSRCLRRLVSVSLKHSSLTNGLTLIYYEYLYTGGREREIRKRETEMHRSEIHHALLTRVGKIHAIHDAIRRR